MSAKKRTSTRPQTIRAIARTDVMVFLLVLLAGLAIRTWSAHRDTFPSVDGVYYMEQARTLVHAGELPFSSFPPGWPLVMTLPLLAMDLADPLAPVRAAQVANVALGTIFGLLGWLALRRLTGRWWALAGGVLLVLLPESIILSRGDMSEMTYACAILAAWLLLDRGRWLAAGLLLGFAYLVRPEALVIVAVAGAVVLLRERRLPWRLALGVVACMVPYVLFVHAGSGVWSLSAKGVFLQNAWQDHQGWSYGKLVMTNAWRLLRALTDMIGWPLAVLAAAGAVLRPRRYLAFLAPMLVLPLFSFPMVGRFWVPYLPFLLLAIAGGLARLRERGATIVPGALGDRGRRLVIAGGAVVLLGLTVTPMLDGAREVPQTDETYLGLKDAGLWLRGQVTRDTVIASYKPYAPFWAWCRHAKIRDDGASAEVICATARSMGARYLVVSLKVAQTIVPSLNELLVTPLPPELQAHIGGGRVFGFRGDPMNNVVVYKLR